MAIRNSLVRAVEATLVAFAIIAGGALVAPGMAAATPVLPETVSAPSVLDPIIGEPIVAPAPVQPFWRCDGGVWPDRSGVNFDCAVGAGATVTVIVWCLDGTSNQAVLTGPNRYQFWMTCTTGAAVTDWTARLTG